MSGDEEEQQRLRRAALKTAESILAARQRVERELREANEALERKSEELRQQREWLEVTLSSIGDAVIATDIQGHVSFLNPSAIAITGWSAADAHGQPLDRVFAVRRTDSPADREPPLSQTLLAGHSVRLGADTLLETKDGTVITIEDSAAPIRDASGNISGTVIVFRDMTERQRSEQALQELRSRLEATLSVAEIGTWTWDIGKDRMVADANLARMLSVTPEVAAGAPLGSYLASVHPDDRPQVQSAIAAAIASEGGSYELDHRILRPDGSIRWLAARGRVRRDSRGSSLHLPGVVIDITDRKQVEEVRNRLADVVASSDDAIVTKTLEGVITSWNQGAERIFGYTPEEAIGKPITILIPEDHIDEEPGILQRLRRGERIEHYETVRRRKDGTLLDISLSVSPMLDVNGIIIGASKIARDITRQKRADEAVHASNQRFRLMADSAPVLIWIADITRACIWLNKTWLDFTGREMDQEIGFGWVQSLHPEDMDPSLKAYAENFDARKPYKMEYRLRRHDGVFRWLIVNAVPLCEGPHGAFSGYIGSCIDITEFRQAAGEREQLLQSERAARTEAERLGRLKDEFLATLSHELRTPLNAILGWATILRRMPVGSDEHTKGLETIERNARIQTQIIADLLDMSGIISGKVQLDVRPVDLHEVICAALDAVRPAANAKNVRLRTTLDAKVGRLRGDGNRLQQVFWNLLTNAVKFTPAGGRIDVVLERVNSHVEISVEDSGIGIKPEFLAFVFDRFRQADASITRRHGGLGLGLSIVKHLVELHGGTVRVKSAGEGKGATFIVALPISVTRSEDAGRHERPSFADVDLFSVELPSLAGITVLIVDDEPDARGIIGRIVEERGARTIVASGGDEALALLRRESADILVSDIGMPDFDGYRLIQTIRSIRSTLPANTRNLPAIALTAYARAEDRQRALLAGYQMHLSKPVEPRELVAGIASLLNVPQRVQRSSTSGESSDPEVEPPRDHRSGEGPG
jgi:PAS domain S-box-containing protein